MAPSEDPGVPATNEMELGQMGNIGQLHRTRLRILRLLLGFLAHLLEPYTSRGIKQSLLPSASNED